MAECSGGSTGVSQENSPETNELTMEVEDIKPEPKEGSDEELYEVEKIVGTTKINGRLLYKVRWRGYAAHWDTFEPVENLQTCLDLIDEFQSTKEEMKQKRTFERKKRKALMEGRSVPDPVEPVVTCVPLPPPVITESGDTLKDTFWRDLEQGKVNLFETDMYSKVKGQGRASRPTSFKPKGAVKKNDTEDNKNLPSRKTVGKKKKIGGKRQKNKVKENNCKDKTETAFDRAQLSCHNGINTPESLCSGSSSRSSSFYADVYSGQKVKSPVSLNSELLVKVERIQMSEDSYSPVSVKTEPSLFTNIIPKEDVSPGGQTSEEEDDLNSSTESPEKPSCSKIMKCEDSAVSPAAMISIPKRSMFNCETEGGKKMRTSDSDIPDHFTCTSASPEKGADQSYPFQAINKANSASVFTPELTPEKSPQMGVSATEISINPPLTSPSYIDKSDLPCIQSTISEGSDLESSCRGDKFSETSPPTDSGEEFMKGEEESNNYTVGLLGTVVELDNIDPDQYDEQEVGISDNEDSAELSERKFQDAVSEGLYEKVKKALDSGKSYNMNGIDATGMTLLMFAAQRGYDDIAELLVKNGARINAQQRNGTTALMLACEHSQLCSVVLMVELGANLNLQLTSGETALMKAVKRGSKLIVRHLLERGANFASQTITGNSAMTYAKMLHVCDVEDILFEHVARLTAEFDRQVSVTINNTAKIMCALFPLQCFPLCDGNKFVIHFKHELQHITPGVGYLLFIAHTRITPQEIKCRFYGPCAISNVTLNGVVQPSLTEEANFVLSCCPLNNGKNELVINTVASPSSKSKLVVCAYKAKMLE